MTEDDAESRIRILLIRHPMKDHGSKLDDNKIRLSIEGERDSCHLANAIQEKGLEPEVYLSSSHRHARQTGEILSSKIDQKSNAQVVELPSLTPHNCHKKETSWENLQDDCDDKSVNLTDLRTIVIIGHEPRLSTFVKKVTESSSIRPFRRGELVCLVSDSFDQFKKSEKKRSINRWTRIFVNEEEKQCERPKIEFRIPTAEYQSNPRPPSSSEILQPKIRSKMSVSTFLAAFTFTSLTILLEGTTVNSFSIEGMAAFFLTLSSALFVASVYMYDRMGMPEDFWRSSMSKSSRLKRIGRYKKHEDMYGPVYAHMVWTWKFVFTPAVILGYVGFLPLFHRSQGWIGTLITLLFLLLIIIYYISERPKLSND